MSFADFADEADTRIVDTEEVLFRQIHPDLFPDGKLSSSAFRPTAADAGQLSVDRSFLTDPAAAFDLYVGNGLKSCAVFGVSVGQFGEEGIPCHSDPLPETHALKANPAHAYANYDGFATKAQKKKAQRLRDKAVTRGCLYPSA